MNSTLDEFRLRRQPGPWSRPGRIVGVPTLITDVDDPRVADFRDLVAGDRRPGTPGNLATARLVADTFEARGFGGGAGSEPLLQRFSHAGR